MPQAPAPRAPGTWTEPRTWVDGETPTGAQFNTQLRDNLNHLKNSPTFGGDIAVTGGISATGDLTVGDDVTVTGDVTVGGDATIVDALTVNGAVTLEGLIANARLKTYSETFVVATITGGALPIDCALGTYFGINLNANCTVTLSNPQPSGRGFGVTLIFNNSAGGARTITWPASVRWPSATAPSMTTTAGRIDIITLVTYDGGASWFGVIVGQNYF